MKQYNANIRAYSDKANNDLSINGKSKLIKIKSGNETDG